MDIGSDISSNYGIFNPGTLNPHQLAQLLSVLSDESVDTTTLDNLQKKLSRSFIAGDSMKVRLYTLHLINNTVPIVLKLFIRIRKYGTKSQMHTCGES